MYVKEVESGLYYEYREVDSLYIADKNERVFEKRLNENSCCNWVIWFNWQ